jgi:two-component system, NarL family, nitrate/nitrite response regulator NarL
MGLKVLLVEDDHLTRLSLEAALREVGFELVGSAASAAEGLRSADLHQPDAALLDLHLGSGPNGLDLAVALRKRNPKIGITFLTSYEDPRLLTTRFDKIPIGSKYITKREVTSILALRDMVTASVTNPRAAAEPSQSSLSGLTKTQIETLRLVSEGLTNVEIAKRRFVTVKSIETAISRAAKALGIPVDSAHNQRVLIAKALFRGVEVSSNDNA